jgi:hypothetical protein
VMRIEARAPPQPSPGGGGRKTTPQTAELLLRLPRERSTPSCLSLR